MKSGAKTSDYHGQAALGIAAWFGNYKCVEFLIKLGVPVNVDGPVVMPALTCAVENYKRSAVHTKCFEFLLKKGADVNVFHESDDKTPLKEAVYKDNPEAVSRLLKEGAHVTITNMIRLPLFCALQADCKPIIVQLLLEAGAVNGKNIIGRTALMMLAKDSGWEYFRAGRLPSQCDNRRVSCIERICRLLKAGAEVGHFDDHANSNALHLSIDGNPEYNFKQVQMILYAAGETLERPTVTSKYLRKKKASMKIALPEHFKKLKENLDLKHLCREAIRKHLLNLDPHTHLFGRIPKIGLPSIVEEYMLYNCTLNFKKENLE